MKWYKMNFPRKPPADFTYDPPNDPLDIIYKDDDIIVLSKPAELLSVSGRKEEHKDCLERRVQEQYPDARIVHRLDMSTSGLMIMALNAAVHRNLGLQFERRETKKIYIARVWGEVKENSGHVDLPLICDWENRPLQMVDYDRGKPSQTDWEVVERCNGITRMILRPITGRTHQLRVHMAEIGYPIIGDDFYAHEPAFRAAKRLHLHANKLMIYHPNSGKKTWFEAPCPF